MEAQTIIGSLVCFPNLYLRIPLLQPMPGSEDIVVSNEDIKVRNSYLGFLKCEHQSLENCPF